MPPRSASKHYRRLLRLQGLTVAAMRRAWARMDPAGSWETQYQQDVGPKVTALVVAAQVAVTRESDTYVAEVLNELAFGPPTTPGVVLPQSLAGVTGDGRPVETLLASSVGRARAASRTMTPEDALAEAQAFMEMITQTILADAARAAEEVAMAQRPWVDGYVRVAEPGACSRCILLAGKFYLFNEGFLRHPLCRCNHLPAPNDPEKLKALIGINSPDRYFESLSEDEQDRIFTRSGAEAIRLGADMGQVVNARRGMTTAGKSRTRASVTDEGLPTRVNESVARLTRDRTGLYTTTTGRGGRRGQARLMPESIFEIAGTDRDEAIRLLRLYRYIA